MDILKIHLFGTPTITWRDQLISVPRRQTRALLYRLAVRLDPCARDELSFLFWPDQAEAEARRNLSHLLTHLRRALPDPTLVYTFDDKIALDAKRAWSDAQAFGTLHARTHEMDAAAALADAIALYTDPLMASFSLPSSPEYEEWMMGERRQFEQDCLHALAYLIDEHTGQNDYDAAIRYAQRYLEIDPLDETIHRRMIELHVFKQNRGAALRQYEQCSAILHEELGVEPMPETRVLYQALHTGALPVSRRPDARIEWTTMPTIEMPLVGREDALHTLQGAHRLARSGVGRFVLVQGEMGIGKSRLLQEFATSKEGQALLMWGDAYPSSYKPPYYLLLQALHSLMDMRDPDAVRAVLQDLPMAPTGLAEIARLLPELRTYYPHLPEPPSATAAAAQVRLFAALSQFFLALAEGPLPLLLCLDNLHWADPATLSWLTHLSQRMARYRILIVAGYLHHESEPLVELRSSLRQQKLLREIELTELTNTEIGSIVRNLSPSAPVDDGLIPRLHTITGGNPFFLLELLRAFTKSGRSWHELDAVSTLPIPGSIRHVIQSRLAHIGAVTGQILEAAAVLAPHISFELVRLTAGRRELEAVHSLDELVARQLLMEREGIYTFHHDLVRRVLLDEMSATRQRVLHQRAARAIQQLNPHAITDLAYHFDAGGHLQYALHYHELAAQRAEAMLAWQEAATHRQRIEQILRLSSRMSPN